MELERKNKRLKVLIVILLVFLAVSVIYFFYDIVLKKNTNNNDNKEFNYTYNSLKGLYNYAIEDNYNFEHATLSPFELYLYDNGCFYYGMPSPTPVAYVGNYVIKNDKIILTYWYGFTTAINKLSDSDLRTNTLTINRNNSLLDSNPLAKYTSETKILLSKATTEEENNFLNSGRDNFQKLISNYLS